VVVLSQGSLTLKDLNLNTWLIVSIGGEDLGLFGRDVGLPWDQRSHDFASGLNA